MKNLIVLAFAFFAVAAQADVIKCNFTEPFVVSTYNTDTQTLSYSAFTGEAKDEVTTIKKVSFLIKAPGEFELISKDGKVLQSLKLNGKGSDGMSDRIYPYEVKDTGFEMMANSGFGGCSSRNLPVVSLPEQY